MDNRCFSRRFNIGGRKCPLEKYLRSGKNNFQANGFLTKNYPQVIQGKRHVVEGDFKIQSFKGCRRWITGVFPGGLI